MKRSTPILFAALVTLPLLAQVSWIGGSSAYETASNWSTGFVPGITNETIYPAGTYTITVDTVVTNARMRFENASVNAEIRVGPAGELVATNGLIVKSGTASKPNSVTISSGKVTLPGVIQGISSGLAEGSYGQFMIANATFAVAGAYWFVGRGGNETYNRMIAGPAASVTTPQVVMGDNASANANEMVVQGANALWHVNGQTRVGIAGRMNALTVTNGGLFRAVALRLGTNSGGNSNTFYVADGGCIEIYVSAAGDKSVDIGNFGSYNRGVVASNGLLNILRRDALAGIGVNTNSISNTLTIDVGGTATNYANYTIGTISNSVNNALIVNGGQYIMPSTNYTLIVGENGSHNKVILSNNGLLDMIGELRLGSSIFGRNNALIASNATVRAPFCTIGLFGSSNAVILANNAQMFLATTNQTSVMIGSDVNARSNRLEMTSGASISGLRDLTVGQNSTGNSLYVGTNANATFGNLIVGMNGNCNSNSIEINAGLVTVTRTNNNEYNSIGKNGAYNTAAIRNGGMMVSSNRVYLGYGPSACFNTLTISEGGILRCTDIIIGDNSNSNNEVIVTGTGSRLLSRGLSTLRVGAGTGSTGNKLSVLDGAFVDAGLNSIGVTYAINSTNNTMVISNATVYCTNNTLYAYNQGKITIQGSNSLVRCKGFTLYTDAALAFEIPREGIVSPALDVSSTVALSIDARLYVSAPEWFAKVGGRLPLIRSATTNDMAKFTTQAILDPAGLSLQLSPDNKTLYLVGPSRAATVLLVR
jgi:T5SS/PEP-CTERM-associated repeat protein